MANSRPKDGFILADAEIRFIILWLYKVARIKLRSDPFTMRILSILGCTYENY